jgi:hypothetical protein
MTLVAPEIVEGILAGRQLEGLMIAEAMQPFPWEWVCQRSPDVATSSETRATPEQIVKNIRGATRKHQSAEEKICIVLEELCGEY